MDSPPRKMVEAATSLHLTGQFPLFASQLSRARMQQIDELRDIGFVLGDQSFFFLDIADGLKKNRFTNGVKQSA